MAFKLCHLISWLPLLLGYFRTVAAGTCYIDGEYEYCDFDCCEDKCCDEPISDGLIIGLCITGGLIFFAVVLIICICRRRQTRGFIYRSGPVPSTTIVNSSMTTTTGGMINTTGAQAGVIAFQYPPYGQYPSGAPPTSQAGYPSQQSGGNYAAAPAYNGNHGPAPPPYA